jgi:hypothetical protein
MCTIFWSVGFEVLTAVSMKIAVFWVLQPRRHLSSIFWSIKLKGRRHLEDLNIHRRIILKRILKKQCMEIDIDWLYLA